MSLHLELQPCLLVHTKGPMVSLKIESCYPLLTSGTAFKNFRLQFQQLSLHEANPLRQITDNIIYTVFLHFRCLSSFQGLIYMVKKNLKIEEESRKASTSFYGNIKMSKIKLHRLLESMKKFCYYHSFFRWPCMK